MTRIPEPFSLSALPPAAKLASWLLLLFVCALPAFLPSCTPEAHRPPMPRPAIYEAPAPEPGHAII